MAAFDLPPMPLLPITSDQTVKNVANMNASDDCIFICSYPKSGTTWTQNIVYQLLTNGAPLDHISNYCPFLEADSCWDVAAATMTTTDRGGGAPCLWRVTVVLLLCLCNVSLYLSRANISIAVLYMLPKALAGPQPLDKSGILRFHFRFNRFWENLPAN